MFWRRFLPGNPAMTEEDSGRVLETEERGHCLDVMLPVYYVGR